MQDKKTKAPSDRQDPKKNKSLAIRNIIEKMPDAKATEIVAAVKKEYGHTVGPERVYMVKTKTNVSSTKKSKKSTPKEIGPMGATQWIAAIKVAQELLKLSGGVTNATSLLKAIDN